MKKNIVWKILIYFIIYSILGFFLETIFAIITKGTLESRQSFLYGPFCIVYGIGAICLIFTLHKYKNSNIKLFLYGMIVGATVEYFTSYVGEQMMHIKWWDYSNAFLNIHGRTCFFYAICWGFLTIPLIKYINPFLDKVIENVFSKIMHAKTVQEILDIPAEPEEMLSYFDAVEQFGSIEEESIFYGKIVIQK